MADGVEAAIQALDRGELVVYPTDTLYGLGCRGADPSAYRKLADVKELPPQRGVSVVVHDLDQARAWTRFTPLAHALADALLPGGLTLVLEATAKAPAHLLSDERTLGIRYVDRAETLALCKGGPVVSTSANVHGQPSATTIKEARDALGEAVAAYVDVGALDGPASTVVDARGKAPKVIREGAIPERDVLEVADGG